MVKRTYRGLNDFLRGYRSRFTILNPGFPDCFYSSVCSSGNRIVVIAYIRNKYMDTPFLRATFQIIVGGVIVLTIGILIGKS